jgi:hypothetical protein
VLHPPYASDQAQSDFFPVGCLKENICGTSFTPGENVIFALRKPFSGIPEKVMKNVFTNWMTRLPWVRKRGGEYDIK